MADTLVVNDNMNPNDHINNFKDGFISNPTIEAEDLPINDFNSELGQEVDVNYSPAVVAAIQEVSNYFLIVFSLLMMYFF